MVRLTFALLSIILSVSLADHDGHHEHNAIFGNNFPSNNDFFAAAPIGLDLRTTIDERTRSTFDQSFDTLSAPGAPTPFPTLAPRQSKQRNGAASNSIPDGIDFSQARRTADGRLCVIKESTVDTIAKDPILECIHKNVEKCHYTYVTEFSPSQEEVCDENFEKNCQITFKQQAVRETVKKCYKPQRKVCNGQGPVECKTIYETSCTTRYIEKQPGKFVGQTECEKLPVEICGAGCITVEGPEECHNKDIDSLIDVPEELCDLNPQKTCRLATKLVPRLKPKHECTIIPQEVCNLKFTTPRTEKKPLKSEWCLDESPVQPDEIYPENKRV